MEDQTRHPTFGRLCIWESKNRYVSRSDLSSDARDQEEEEYILNEARNRSERKVQWRITSISDDLVV
jgi:hypothetical protein